MGRALIILGFIGMAIWAHARVTAPEPQTAHALGATAPASLPVKPVPQPWERVSIANQNWHTGGFDTVAIVNLTLTNDNGYPVKDVHLACRYYAPSGTLLTVRTPVVYETIPGKARKTVHNLNVGFVHSQAQKGGCEVVSAIRD